jgi:soluble lytic murein transglycosylase-like protein
MFKWIVPFVLVFSFVLSSQSALAAGLVPCGGPSEEPCQTCHVVGLVTNIFNWLGSVLGILVVIFIIVSGVYLAMSGSNASAMGQTKHLIAKVLVGYIIFLGAWIVVDTGLKMLVDDATYGVWNAIQCTAQPTAQAWSRTTASGANATEATPAEVASAVAAIVSSGSLQTDITNAATAAGITDITQIKTLRALISQESSNCANKVGPETPYGTAYGCGQLLVSTARSLDPSSSGLSNDELAAKLRDDDMYNLTLSARYFRQLLGSYGNKIDWALAAYNGGPAANLASSDCPGQRRWECVWDSPGCYGTGDTSCEVNVGYKETRNYVSNITRVAGGL